MRQTMNLSSCPGAAYISTAGRISITVWSLLLVGWFLTESKLWFWVLWESFPTLVLIAVPVLLSATVPFMSTGRRVWSLVLVSLIGTSLPRTDFSKQFLARSECRSTISDTAPITILSWNTAFWGEGHHPSLGVYLNSVQADVVALQEVQTDVRHKYIEFVPPEFPSPKYNTVLRKGELLIATNYQVLNDNQNDRATPYLWADLHSPSTGKFRLINVHIPVHISLSLLPQLDDFFGFVKKRFIARHREFRQLRSIIEKSPLPVAVVGDFNSTTSMSSFRAATRTLCDSVSGAGLSNPMTWSLFGLRLWRPDYVLTSPDINNVSYETVPMNNISDHQALRVTFKL